MTWRYITPHVVHREASDGSSESKFAAALPADELALVPPWQPPAPTAADVRLEASRRMRILVGARDEAHFSVIMSNALREGLRYSNVLLSGNTLTSEEAARRTVLMETDRRIEDLRRCSNVLELICPDDYTADRHWSLT